MRYPRPNPLCSSSLALCAALLLAPAALSQRVSLSGGGAGVSAGRTGAARPGELVSPGGLNEGGLTVDDFDYEPDMPPSFQPFDGDDTLLTERRELALVVPNASQFPAASWFQEDPSSGSTEIAGTRNLFGSANLRAIVSGNLDADAEQELVAIEIAPARDRLIVWAADRLAGGYAASPLFEVGAETWDYLDADVQLGDVDGDGALEFVVVARPALSETVASAARMRVFDDASGGFAELGSYYRSGGHREMRAYPGDVDGDGRDEVLVYLQGDSTSNRMPVRLLDDATTGFATVVGWSYFSQSWGKITLGDFDGDGKDEVAVADQADDSVRFYDFQAPSSWIATASVAVPQTAAVNHQWDLTTIDRDADGVDELALLNTIGSAYRVHFIAWDASQGQWSVDQHFLGVSGGPGYATRIAAGDTDADDFEELYVAVTTTSTSQPRSLQTVHVDWDPSEPAPTLELGAPQVVGGLGDQVPPSIAAADVDGDGFRLRYVRKFLAVADPIPLVLMHAPPTKAGIDQNYDETGTSYTASTSSSESIGVTNAITASVSVGFEAEDLFGLFGASVKATVESAFERADIETTRTTFVQGYGGAYQDDLIIFQATLYRSYEYEVVSAPESELVGSYITLDRPVDVNIYKWTVDYYNASVTLADRLPASLTPHTVGDPASYRNRDEQAAHVASYVSWSSAEVTLGQSNGGTNSVAIEFEQENTTEEQRTLGVGVESEFKAGGVTVGGSIAISETDLYSVSISEATAYEGVVGDVGDVVQYDDWLYNFGVTVHQHGVNADAANLPTSIEPGVQPFLVVSYWTHLTGGSY